MSYCHQPMSIIHHASLGHVSLCNLLSETTGPKALIFGIKHCLVDRYQVCSVGDPRVQNGPACDGGSWVQK